MTTLTATQARQQFFQLQDKLFDDSEEIRIAFKKGSAVLLNAEDYENFLEHIYLMQDPVLMNQLRNRSQLKKEQFYSLAELKNALEN